MRRRKQRSPAHAAVEASPQSRLRRVVLVLAAGFLLYFWQPLFSSRASIQWDAVDVHYTSQRYFAQEVLAGRLPVWTPYLFSGFPFLADPQVGAFYPLNWPFMALGCGPKAIQAELLLHSLLAAWGMFLFLRLWAQEAWAAGLGALSYPLSGFFAAHASHVGMYQAASLLPGLLYFAERSLRNGLRPWVAGAASAAAMVLLAGHFQTSLYALTAFGLYLALRVLAERALARRAAAVALATVLPAFMIAAVMVLPGLELTAQSVRVAQDFSSSKQGSLTLGSLATLLWPDALGARAEVYRGPDDRTQHYFYGGILLLPLALLGLSGRRQAWLAGTMAVAAVWFMLGPSGGLYRLVALVPGFAKVRAPVHAWFVAAFALSWLAASGLSRLQERLGWRWLGLAVCAAMALDLSAVNSWSNPLAYARESFEELYGARQEWFRSRVAPLVPEGRRLEAPDRLTVFGPLNAPLEVRVETTFGYNPLELRGYAEYRSAAATNPRLKDALAAALELDPARGILAGRSTALPKAWFPKVVRSVASEADSRAGLSTLDPSAEALVFGASCQPGRDATVEWIRSGINEWRVGYQAPHGGLLVLSLPFYPGWQAEAAGRQLPVRRVNHALSGVEAPAGRGELRLRFQSRWLATGCCVSAVGVLLLGVLAWPGRKPAATAGSGAPVAEGGRRSEGSGAPRR